MSIITLTTDFGTRDGFVGSMKGVIARLAGDATVVDISHDVPRHDIAHGAWVIATTCQEYPHGTIHVAVVDPGVGGARASVIVKVRDQLFVGPDNGLFAYAAEAGVEGAWLIESAAFRLPDVSPTFHGRDVFAPAAAALARGRLAATAGRTAQLVGALPWGPRPIGQGRVVHIDHFGNLITDLPRGEAGTGAVAIAGMTLPLVRTYESVAIGQPLAYIGSSGTVEIAVREARADQVLVAPRGTIVIPAVASGPYR